MLSCRRLPTAERATFTFLGNPGKNKLKTSAKRIPAALRLARRAWRIQYLDSHASITLANLALAKAAADDDLARAWAQLASGYHTMRYLSPAQGLPLLDAALAIFSRLTDRHGEIIATVCIARCWWMQGRNDEALELLLPLRAEGLAVLVQEERGMLLNGIAGCYSTMGESVQAFAYMYQALRESQPSRNRGFDVVLDCNLAHELILLGDYEEALTYADEGIARCARLNNPRLMGVLLLNRMTCYSGLNRASLALADLHRLLAMPADADGRGASNPAFEQLALSALHANDLPLGARLIERARATLTGEGRMDEQTDLIVAEAELARLLGDARAAVRHLDRALPTAVASLSLPVRCRYYQARADAHEYAGDSAHALHYLRLWQTLHVERSHTASRARHQAASLKPELLRLQRQRDEIDARHQSAEKARNALAATNQQLSQTILEVESERERLKDQALHDALTGLYSRRYLGSVLPSLLATAKSENLPAMLSVAIIDLDHFKLVNDHYGHLAGDDVLRAFAALLLKCLRTSDIVCRYGGEEFCVLMPRTTLPNARQKIETLLRAWRAMRLEVRGKLIEQQSFSAGVADSAGGFEVGGEVTEAMLKRADDRALEAKRSGRNRVVGG